MLKISMSSSVMSQGPFKQNFKYFDITLQCVLIFFISNYSGTPFDEEPTPLGGHFNIDL